MLNHWARHLGKDVQAFSAGSATSGRINPLAMLVLQESGVDTAGLRSKNWDEFAKPDAPKMRVVIAVFDQAAAEVCPYWPGSPVMVHWGFALRVLPRGRTYTTYWDIIVCCETGRLS